MSMSADAVVTLLDALGDAGVEVAVAGGWAVDALVGRATREHGDLDLAVEAGDAERAAATMRGLGFRVVADELPGRLVLGDGVRSVDLHPVVRDASGIGRQTSRDGEVFVYPPGSTDAAGVIGGRSVRCLTPELLVTFHLGYEPRPIDRADMAALAEAFDLALPAPYDAGGGSPGAPARRVGGR
jgi:lincosamide nucleotidyltransferase A/C/D/E